MALVLATVVNTSLNRRWTFGVLGARHAARHQVQGLGVFVATWAMTAGALLALGSLWSGAAPTPVQTLVVGVATVVATVIKFVLMHTWMFTPAPSGSAGPQRSVWGAGFTGEGQVLARLVPSSASTLEPSRFEECKMHGQPNDARASEGLR